MEFFGWYTVVKKYYILLFYSVTGEKVISLSHKDFRKCLFPGTGEGADLGELQGEDRGEVAFRLLKEIKQS